MSGGGRRPGCGAPGAPLDEERACDVTPYRRAGMLCIPALQSFPHPSSPIPHPSVQPPIFGLLNRSTSGSGRQVVLP